MGININQVVFADSLANPVSLKQITGSDHNVLELAQSLHRLLLKRIGEMSTHIFSKTLEEYNLHLYAKNKKARLKKNGAIIETLVKGVSESGQLVTMDAHERRYSFGEVEWLL
jgi:biotin-(acetyl-CoA carboxylase) ligase